MHFAKTETSQQIIREGKKVAKRQEKAARDKI